MVSRRIKAILESNLDLVYIMNQYINKGVDDFFLHKERRKKGDPVK